jgi:hypothetical protein
MADTCGEPLGCDDIQGGMNAVIAASYVRLADGPNGELRTARRTASCTGGEGGGGTVTSVSANGARLITGSSDGSPTAPALTLQAAGLLRNITKVAHGFTTRQAIRVSAAGVSDLAQGDSAANAKFTGFVFDPAPAGSADIFVLALPGSYLESGFVGLSGGTDYYLDPTTPGAITATPNAFGAVLRASSATGGYVMQPMTGDWGVKAYSANISQTGTDAPVVNRVYRNTLGGTPVFTRSNNGNYSLTLAGTFTLNKTKLLGAYMASTGDLVMIQPEYVDADVVRFNSFLIDLVGGTFTPSDDTILNFDFDIIVYP